MVIDQAEKISLYAAGVFSTFLLYVSMGQMVVDNLPVPNIINIDTHPMNFAVAQLLATVVVMFIGKRIFISGFKALFHKVPNMDTLVAISCTASFLYSLVMTFLISDMPHQVHNLFL